MRRGFILFFCACWVVSVASMGLRAGRPFAQPQAAAGGHEPPGRARCPAGKAPRRSNPSRRSSSRYCVTCHNARTKTGGLSLEELDPAAAASHSTSGKRSS